MKPVLERRSVTDGRPIRLGERVLMRCGSLGMVVGEEWRGNREVVSVMKLGAAPVSAVIVS